MSRPPRLPGFEYRGLYQYFVTFCTFERCEVLRDDPVARLVVLTFRRTARARKFALLAYCLMPDHVHLLIEGMSDRADLRRFVKQAKQSSGQAYSAQAQRRLWQEGYHDRVLRDNEDPKEVARYIIGNPVRAGLVANLFEYPYIGSDVWSLDELVESVL